MKDDQKNIPTGKIKRSTLVGLTTTRAGIKKLGYLSQKPFLSDAKKAIKAFENDEEIAAMIFKSLSMLKGTTLKAAQMMSMEMEMIPPAYRKELAKACSQVPPINRALIRKIIIDEFDSPPEKVFKSFESEPFAAASLGQVHRAVTHKGIDVAVKIQYPGISTGVKSDIAMVKLLLKPTRCC